MTEEQRLHGEAELVEHPETPERLIRFTSN
jgi:hypothetical protein